MNQIDETLAQHQHYKQECNVSNRTVFCHDNLEILQGINSECIDLIYLDPPFNKKKTFTAPIGTNAEGASFKDIFTQEDVKDDWVKTIEEDHCAIHELLNAVKRIEGRKSYNFCYLAYMAIRLIECHRVLKDTGSLYLHCDPTMSHYLKLLLDCIFGEKNFRNEIVWWYRGPSNAKNNYPKKHDILLYFAINAHNVVFDSNQIKKPYSQSFLDRREYAESKGGKGIMSKYNQDGRSKGEVLERFGDGQIPSNVWNEFQTGGQISSKERTGYPTQKPLALLERIIKASSNKGDVVLDPFCGCATTCVAAEKLERHWIGIDISVKAYELVKERLKKEVANPDNLFDYDKAITFSTNAPKRTDSGAYTTDTKYIYVISHPKYPDEYKVGIASDWRSRLNGYQTGDPERSYKVEYTTRVSNYRTLEQYIHNTFPNKHEWVHGELTEIIKAIERNGIT